MGMSWDFLCEENLQRPVGQKIRATFAVYENFCAMLHAAKFCKVSEAEMNDIFFDNAKKLFKL